MPRLHCACGADITIDRHLLTVKCSAWEELEARVKKVEARLQEKYGPAKYPSEEKP
jgi:hypothetical protein